MKWNRTKTSKVIEDIKEAQQMREESDASLKELQNQDSLVTTLTARLRDRREVNGFGDDVQITFTRRHA